MSEDELQSLQSSKSDSKSSLEDKTSLEDQTGSATVGSRTGSIGSSGLDPEPEAERLKMLTHILNSILDSEAIYLECLRDKYI